MNMQMQRVILLKALKNYYNEKGLKEIIHENKI